MAGVVHERRMASWYSGLVGGWPSARNKLAASGHSGCFGRSEMGGSAFCSRERTAEWPQPTRQRPLGGPAIGRFVGSKIPRFCDFYGFCWGLCAFVSMSNFALLFTTGRAGCLSCAKTELKWHFLAGFS